MLNNRYSADYLYFNIYTQICILKNISPYFFFKSYVMIMLNNRYSADYLYFKASMNTQVFMASQSRQGVEKVPQLKESDKGRSAIQAGKIMQVNERYVRVVKKLKEAHKEKEIEELRQGHHNMLNLC
jgi:hypothetical protein